MPESAPFYNDLDLSLAEARRLIDNGAHDRRHSAHHPVVGSIGKDGLPRQRVMILRALDWDRRLIRFHTDYRTEKVGEFASNNLASVLVYEPESKIQLRLSGTASVHASGPAVDAAWEEATLFARRCYLAEDAPGTVSGRPLSGLPEWVEGRPPSEEEVAPARANFAILLFEFSQIEWLYLANAGHRRARWEWNSANLRWDGDWLVP
ncbi:MAG: pyridoxamine 5'-phosphate oxidase family protein [Sphingorhabdus sp.]